MPEDKVWSFTTAMLDFFGKNGKSNTEFLAEMKALTDEDKAYFKAGLVTVGYRIG